MRLTRRTLLASASASLAAPAIAQVDPFAAALTRAQSFDQLRSLIVKVDGETRVADAIRGPALERPANIKSVSKSIVAVLTGIAIDNGAIPGVNSTVEDIAPRLLPNNASPGAAKITVEDLVTLRAGLERTSGPNYGSWVSSRNWVANALSRPIVAAPGTRMLYSTGSTHILGALLSEATGESLLTLARLWIGNPLDIEIPAWTRDPQGYYLGGNEMAISPLDLSRFAEMIRQGGSWEGERIVSQDWLNRSFTPVTRSPWSGLGYGYGWFLGTASGHAYALARGYGGQVVAIAPSLNISITITSDPNRPARSGGYFGDLMGLIENDIIATLA